LNSSDRDRIYRSVAQAGAAVVIAPRKRDRRRSRGLAALPAPGEWPARLETLRQPRERIGNAPRARHGGVAVRAETPASVRADSSHSAQVNFASRAGTSIVGGKTIAFESTTCGTRRRGPCTEHIKTPMRFRFASRTALGAPREDEGHVVDETVTANASVDPDEGEHPPQSKNPLGTFQLGRPTART